MFKLIILSMILTTSAFAYNADDARNEFNLEQSCSKAVNDIFNQIKESSKDGLTQITIEGNINKKDLNECIMTRLKKEGYDVSSKEDLMLPTLRRVLLITISWKK